MDLAENIQSVKRSVPPHVKLIAISKTKPVNMILQAYEAGQKIFGENKVQELVAKQPLLPDDIEWHFVGHLQSNKVKYIAPFVSLIHSVDSLNLLQEVNKQAAKNNRVIGCLLQFHIAKESTKFGFSPDEATQVITSPAFSELKNVKITGVMGMATFTDDMNQVRDEFRNLHTIFDSLKEQHFSTDAGFKEISMGMSDDYKIAIEEGSTMVRIGSAIFGTRG